SLFIIDLMGFFFYNKIGSIISIVDLPTTNIIEPNYFGEQLDIVLLFLFSGGKMTKELQLSRYIVISFLVREMGIDIVKAISLMAELEKSGLVRLESSGDLILKELGGEL
ncbi:TPA: hypothetical protein ACOO16_002217, partial [Streptococcus pneumoniae]